MAAHSKIVPTVSDARSTNPPYTLSRTYLHNASTPTVSHHVHPSKPSHSPNAPTSALLSTYAQLDTPASTPQKRVDWLTLLFKMVLHLLFLYHPLGSLKSTDQRLILNHETYCCTTQLPWESDDPSARPVDIYGVVGQWSTRSSADESLGSTIGETSSTVISMHNAGRHSVNDLTSLVTRDSHHPAASGGFADIYTGTVQLETAPIKVAIKAIRTYSGKDSDHTKKEMRLHREVEVWRRLKHDNVLPLLGTAIGFGRLPALVCPWAENGTLTSYLKDRHADLTQLERLNLLDNVASGLHYLHSQSVVHGDLSGSNILVNANGNTWISDFGLSTLLSELGGLTFATSFHGRGTMRWIAPELLDLSVPEDESPSTISPTTYNDIYSFGGVMLQILSGKVPYHYYSYDFQVMHAVLRGITPRRPRHASVTPRRWAFIQRCWSTVDIMRSRPTTGEIVKFTKNELAHVPGS